MGERGYRLYVMPDPGGGISRSMMTADLDGPPPGFVELRRGEWWADIVAGAGERWYLEDGEPRRRSLARIVVDRERALADGSDAVTVSLDGAPSRSVHVRIDSTVVQLVPGQDSWRLVSGFPGRFSIVVVDPRYLREERQVEFEEEPDRA